VLGWGRDFGDVTPLRGVILGGGEQSLSVAVVLDETAAIGKRYRRMDEAGTPFCITIDGDTLADGTVTVRERDAMTQIRLPEDRVAGFLDERLG